MLFTYDATGVRPMSGISEPFPKGEYQMYVADATQTMSKAGDPQVIVDAVVASGEYAGKHTKPLYVTFPKPDVKWAGIAIHFLKCIGQPFEGKLSVDTNAWKGARFTAEVDLVEWNGKQSNEIKTVSPAKVEAAVGAGDAQEDAPF